MTIHNGGWGAVVEAKTGAEVKLAMQRLWLTGRILPVGARLVVAHTFRSAETHPIEVVYAFGLPRDAALRRFQIAGDGFRVRSELKPVREAQEAYEAGLDEGHLASLARTYRDGRVNLSVGNIRPGELVRVFLELVAGVDLRDGGLRFRFPFTLAPCYHAEARAVEVEPGVGEQELPEKEFGDVLLPQYVTDATALHAVGFDLSIDLGATIASVSSPSHTVRATGLGTRRARVALSRERDLPDRDLVLDAETREEGPRWWGGWVEEGMGRFTAVIPSTLFPHEPAPPKSVVFVLDRSGSMQGPTMAQARKAVEACLGTLSAQDRFGFVAFDDHVEVFQPTLRNGTLADREALGRFLAGVDARGGTRLAEGIDGAVKLAGQERVELFVVTDGQVAATESILATCRSARVRLHCLGIGAASQDRFLTLLARETGGLSRFVTPRERVDLAALDLFASIGQPVATGVEVDWSGLPGGQAVVPSATAVYQGHPLVVMGLVQGAGQGTVRVRRAKRDGQELVLPIELGANPDASTVCLLQGARMITDVETRLPGELREARQSGLIEREQRRVGQKLERLSQEYGLTSRAMALVAVVERPGDDATQLPRTQVVPVGMPEDTAFGSYFVQRAAAKMRGEDMLRSYAVKRCTDVSSHIQMSRETLSETLDELCHRTESLAEMSCPAPPDPRRTPEDILVTSAGRLLPDGGMPGADTEGRVLNSVCLLVAFAALGHSRHSGPFRLHVDKLLAFIRQELPQLKLDERRERVAKIVDRVERGVPFEPDVATVLVTLLENLNGPAAPGPEPWKTFEHLGLC